MGYYINPPDMTKEDFLKTYGKPLESPVDFDFSSTDLPVCWVDNGWMTAAAIAYDKRERDVFYHDTTGRPMRWYSVPRAHLLPYYNPRS